MHFLPCFTCLAITFIHLFTLKERRTVHFTLPDFTLEKAAAHLYTNRTYLSILINSQFGVPFRDYINRLRIECAKELIRSQRSSHLEDIALASGFSSGSQFSRKFKEIEGVTPNAWIRSMMQ